MQRIKFYTTSLVAVLVFASSSFAQKLDQVETAVKKGNAQEARTLLERWQKANPNARDARAAFLAAKLTTDASDAETAYLQVAISYSTSPYAAEALYRLGQARAAAGDTKQSKEYFQRLNRDYPTSPFATPSPPPKPSPQPEPKPISAKYTIQLAAFKDIDNANGVMKGLTRSGYDARVVTVPENGLYRVRVGKFANSNDATATIAKLKSAGYVGVVVSDVERESKIKN